MKRIFLWLIICCFVSTIHAQTESSMQRINIKSPEISAFMKVGEVPVNLYAGIPQISIPIYEARSGELVLPISLDYQGTAIQVNQEATWVGLNWLLNAGGMITSQTTKPDGNALKDDWDFLYNKLALRAVSNNDLGQVYNMDGCHEMNWRGKYGFNRFKGILYPSSSDISPELYSKILDNYEGEAQSYRANFMGHSFEFIYHPLSGKFIVTGNDKKYKIEGDATSVTKVTDADGIEYTFGITETNALEAYTNAPYAKRSVSFYLTQVKHPSGRTINLRYNTYGSIRLLPEVLETWYYNYPGKTNYKVEKKLSDLVKIKNYYLSEISTDDVVISFNVSARTDLQGGRKLDNIEIKNKAGNLLKRFRFTYQYITGNNTGGDRLYDYYTELNQLANYNALYNANEIKTRLSLVSLQEETVEGSQTKTLAPYKFQYIDGLPGKTSSARDYWGYYNGKANKSLLTARAKTGESGYNNFPYGGSPSATLGDRRCSPTAVSAGMLSRITYPTGGTTELSYEPHTFTNFIYLDQAQSAIQKEEIDLRATGINAEFSYPKDELAPKEFTIQQDMQAEATVTHSSTYLNVWRTMLGSPAQIIAYKNIGTAQEPDYRAYPYKIWVLNPPDTINAPSGSVVNSIIRKEKFILPAGKYRLQANISGEQISPNQSPLPIQKVEIRLKGTSFPISRGAGVRIKQIKQTDGNGNTYTTDYEYIEADGTPSGMLMAPLHFTRKKMQVYQQPANYGDAVYPTAEQKEYWVGYSEDMAAHKGIPVGYSRVVVKQANGKVATEFWNRRNTNQGLDYLPPLLDPRNGNITREEVYSNNGQLKRETDYTYSILAKEHHFVNAIIEDIYYGPNNTLGDRGNLYADLCNGGRMQICIYPSSKFHVPCTRKVVSEYEAGDTLVTSYDYTYNPWNLQPAMVKITREKGNSETLHTLYPVNYAQNGNYPATLVGKNLLNLPIETVRMTERDSSTYVTNGQLNRYNDKGQLTGSSMLRLLQPKAAGSFKFSNCTQQGKIGTDTLNRGSYSPSTDYLERGSYGYTANGNLSYVTEKQSLTTVYLWSYQKQHPIAKVENTTYAEIKKALGFTSDTQITSLEAESTPDVAAIRKKLDDYFKGSTVLITTYTYKPGIGMTGTTLPNGEKRSYEYDSFGRLSKVKNHEGNAVKQYDYHYKN